MPELPEVETVKRGLQPSVEGRRLTSVETRRGDLRAPFPEDFESRLTGRRVERLWRRAKYIMADLDGGETLVIHLGMSGRTRVYKSALVDQRVIAGLGNIYACESLWRSRISPKRKAAKINGANLDVLARAVKEVLKQALSAGGSSLRDHRQTNGELGNFQNAFAVYDREGQRCMRRGCDGTIKRIVQSGRSTFYCPSCQTY